jgi:hypothetical protein
MVLGANDEALTDDSSGWPACAPNTKGPGSDGVDDAWGGAKAEPSFSGAPVALENRGLLSACLSLGGLGIGIGIGMLMEALAVNPNGWLETAGSWFA